MDYAKTYGQMHEAKPRNFSGYSIKNYVSLIAAFVAAHRPARILDYGSGKGYQYLAMRVHEAWGGPLPICYDPGVHQLRTKPDGKFGGIICTDVMEHIEEADVTKVLGDLFSFAEYRAFVFFCIACRPSKRKKLPDGRDVHVTIKPPKWWDSQIDPFRRVGLTVRVVYDETTPGKGKTK